MKRRVLLSLATLTSALAAAQEEHGSEDDLFRILLDETAIQNLRIETVAAEERDFETTVFAIGRIEEIPSRHSVLSSRIPGRVVELKAFVGDQVEAGQVLARIESRQPGNPPPTIPLKAPQSGLVISSHVRIGEPVEPDRELLDISDRSTMWAVAKV
ncbi:MAG: efflux RND transporter periplasmic adaptor subunit, partial [Roseibacillus sp.]|nr:efflux RND transporter periplasmic adaptor subunit [Roseibacillus sp.]